MRNDLTLLHDHFQSLICLDPTIVYPYEINFQTIAMNILKNENECALNRFRKSTPNKREYE
jgi:hypothetical protein